MQPSSSLSLSLSSNSPICLQSSSQTRRCLHQVASLRWRCRIQNVNTFLQTEVVDLKRWKDWLAKLKRCTAVSRKEEEEDVQFGVSIWKGGEDCIVHSEHEIPCNNLTSLYFEIVAILLVNLVFVCRANWRNPHINNHQTNPQLLQAQ